MDVDDQADVVIKAENRTMFKWRIKNFSRLNSTTLYSSVFATGGFLWRVLVFPGGNSMGHFSIYLVAVDFKPLCYTKCRYTNFSLTLVNLKNRKLTVRKDVQHYFHNESVWAGFTLFIPLGALVERDKGFISNDTCVIKADVTVPRIVDYWMYDSKKETGFVGLKLNPAATSYMNSLLQTLYHIPSFRKAVYHMPTTEHDMPSTSVPLALQILFCKLWYNETDVGTKEVAKSIGLFMHQNAQQLKSVLCEKLEEKIKGTSVEGTIQKLFEGHRRNYLRCINAHVKSTRKESFYDLQLDVKGCCDVYASFDKYVEVKRRKYVANYIVQDAMERVLFIDFPPVLVLQLKRSEYDDDSGTIVKIGDRYEFPLELDLDRGGGKYLSPDADKSGRNLYTLHSVLVHIDTGDETAGDYYAFIRPTLSDQWFKFDDERVTKDDLKRVEEQYGGDEGLPPGFNRAPFKCSKYSNACMLVYIRESLKETIFCDVNENDIAEHLRIRLQREKEEKEIKKRCKAEAFRYTVIKVARDDDLERQIGTDIYFGLVDHEKVQSFRIQKHTPFNSFKEEVAKELGIPVQFQRFWLWGKRGNQTYRPQRPLTAQEESLTVRHLMEVFKALQHAELRLFLEIESGPDLTPLPLPEKTKHDILLFFKLYDPKKLKLRYVGRFFVKRSSKVIEIIPKLKELVGFSPDEEIQCYEEIAFEPNVVCKLLQKTASFKSSQIVDGGIICFQKLQPTHSVEKKSELPDVPSFFGHAQKRQVNREWIVAGLSQ